MNYVTQYEIYDLFQEKKFIFINFIRRNFKPDFYKDYLYKDTIKKNIAHYNLEKIIPNLYYRVLKHKTGEVQISQIIYKFIKFIKNNYEFEDKKIKKILNEFPNPKYLRKKWKRYYILKNDIKKLKSIKRKVKKKYYGKVLEEKLENINEELFIKQKRLKELSDILK